MATDKFDRDITITWDNPEGDYYIVEGNTTSNSSIRSYDQDDTPPAKGFKLNYTQSNEAKLSSASFNYYGTYRVSVIHIRSEYAVVSQGGEGDVTSSSITDIRGNIDGGYGIFTGIAKYTRSITVE